ncbi:MAG TPA: polysaccharide deacetylase family protein [Candidatus Binataceae bacterium]|jgi:peptidoglycan/xylan/chitin deacetylase (PgdA/CDA1 family)|nr:polysaccharide deacetylase family protein [Candidatus Binataceae bacterium]
MRLALKIDVDTHQGLRDGVPRLMRLLRDHQLPATFFIAMGPDNSGRAVMRAFRNPGFLTKMRRTRAVSMYGWRTILSGTLLPARPIALAFPDLLRDLAATFEVGIHGYDHVLWQDHIDDLSDADLRAELAEAAEAYRAIFATSPRSFAAPGWRVSPAAMRALERLGLDYRSDTRGRCPYRCRVDGEVLRTPEIPTTLPTLDEVLGTPELAAAPSLADFYLRRMSEDLLNVHTIHAETEGLAHFDAFAECLATLRARGVEFLRLDQVAAGLHAAELPLAEVVRATLPGRAGWISAQAPDPLQPCSI